jgi:DNA-binding IclR family transcriptional regulator
VKGPQPKPSKPTESLHPKDAAAVEMDQRVIDLLRSQPGLKTAAIAEKTGSKTSTTVERLKRLQSRGQVQRDDQGAYAAIA